MSLGSNILVLSIQYYLSSVSCYLRTDAVRDHGISIHVRHHSRSGHHCGNLLLHIYECSQHLHLAQRENTRGLQPPAWRTPTLTPGQWGGEGTAAQSEWTLDFGVTESHVQWNCIKIFTVVFVIPVQWNPKFKGMGSLYCTNSVAPVIVVLQIISTYIKWL